MDPGAPWKTGKKEQQVWVEEEEGGGVSGVERLRGYYDEARSKLKSYLGREDAMGSGSSTPRPQGGVGVVEGGVGGTVFQQRPAHCRLEGRTDVESGEEFTDISYSDLGFIITPNVGYMDHQDCDPVSSAVESGNTTYSSTIPSPCSTSSPSTTSHPSLQHRASSSSFALTQHISGAHSPSCPSPKNLDDLKVRMGERGQVFRETWLNRCYKSLVTSNPSCLQLLEEVSAALSRYVTEPQESELRQQALFLLLGPEYTAKHFPYHRYNVRALEPPLNPQRKESYMKEARVFLDRCFSRALNDLSYPKDASRYSRRHAPGEVRGRSESSLPGEREPAGSGESVRGGG
ncbi:uncharacterized protein LOC135094175 isoform X4 [Scylla paramamosain]|uniref:uncharacterized protein LOC135094175 isoform X4 n=1 Tax=Scylla paramamosain TaxID=85552 RepID=UPI003082802A